MKKKNRESKSPWKRVFSSTWIVLFGERFSSTTDTKVYYELCTTMTQWVSYEWRISLSLSLMFLFVETVFTLFHLFPLKWEFSGEMKWTQGSPTLYLSGNCDKCTVYSEHFILIWLVWIKWIEMKSVSALLCYFEPICWIVLHTFSPFSRIQCFISNCKTSHHLTLQTPFFAHLQLDYELWIEFNAKCFEQAEHHTRKLNFAGWQSIKAIRQKCFLLLLLLIFSFWRKMQLNNKLQCRKTSQVYTKGHAFHVSFFSLHFHFYSLQNDVDAVFSSFAHSVDAIDIG